LQLALIAPGAAVRRITVRRKRISPAARRGATGFPAFDTIIWGKLNVWLMPQALNAVASSRAEPFRSRAPAPLFCRDVELATIHAPKYSEPQFLHKFLF
jgi:hypothetical protein